MALARRVEILEVKGAVVSVESKLKHPPLIRCRLCRTKPKVVDDYAEGAPELGHYEIECPCGVYVWNVDLTAAADRWNRLMRVKR